VPVFDQSGEGFDQGLINQKHMKNMSKHEKLLLSSGGESVRCGAPCDHTTVGGRAWAACKRSLPQLPRHSPPAQLSPGGGGDGQDSGRRKGRVG